MEYAAIIGAAISAITSVIEAIRNGTEREGATQMIMDQYAAAMGVSVPELKDLMIQAGQADLVKEVEIDSVGRDAQLRSLQQLSSLAEQGGMDAGARQALSEADNQAQQFGQQQRQGILNDAERRGTLTSGDTMAAQMAAAQGSANMLSRGGIQAAADARARALQAMIQSGSLAGQIRSGDDQTAENNRKAAQERELFNAKMRQSADQYNSEAAINRAKLGLNRADSIGRAAAAKIASTGVNTKDNSILGAGDSINKLIGGISQYGIN